MGYLIFGMALCGVASAFIADKKGLDPMTYGIIGVLTGIIGIIIVAAVPGKH